MRALEWFYSLHATEPFYAILYGNSELLEKLARALRTVVHAQEGTCNNFVTPSLYKSILSPHSGLPNAPLVR